MHKLERRNVSQVTYECWENSFIDGVLCNSHAFFMFFYLQEAIYF